MASSTFALSGSRAGIGSAFLVDNDNLNCMLAGVGSQSTTTVPATSLPQKTLTFGAGSLLARITPSGSTQTYVLSSVRASAPSTVITHTDSGVTFIIANLGVDFDYNRNVNVGITGVGATGAVGVLSRDGNANIQLSGLAISSAFDTPEIEVSVSLTGFGLTAARGTLSLAIADSGGGAGFFLAFP